MELFTEERREGSEAVKEENDEDHGKEGRDDRDESGGGLLVRLDVEEGVDLLLDLAGHVLYHRGLLGGFDAAVDEVMNVPAGS